MAEKGWLKITTFSLKLIAIHKWRSYVSILTILFTQFLSIRHFVFFRAPPLCGFILAEDRFAKRVSITAKKQPLSFVLNQISQSTGYIFLYDQDWSDLSVTVRVKNFPIDKVSRKITYQRSVFNCWVPSKDGLA